MMSVVLWILGAGCLAESENWYRLRNLGSVHVGGEFTDFQQRCGNVLRDFHSDMIREGN